MDTLTNSLAYKFVAMLLMLIEANRVAQKLELPMEYPISIQSVSAESTVNPPKLLGFGGSIITKEFFFGFTDGRLRYVHRLQNPIEAGAVREVRSLNELTNQAYLSGRRWLAALDIDVGAMEAVQSPRISGSPQATTHRATSAQQPSLREPLIEIAWGKVQVHPKRAYAVPAATVWVSARTLQLMRLRVEGTPVYWRGPVLKVSDLEGLLQLPDDAFACLPEADRQHLFEKHTGQGYPRNMAASKEKP